MDIDQTSDDYAAQITEPTDESEGSQQQAIDDKEDRGCETSDTKTTQRFNENMDSSTELIHEFMCTISQARSLLKQTALVKKIETNFDNKDAKEDHKTISEDQIQQPTTDAKPDTLSKISDDTQLSDLCGHLSSILDILKYISSISANETTEVDTTDHQTNIHADWVEDGSCFNTGEDDDDDESMVDDSDDESSGNKLCTFTLTQKEFVNQHWYHCHTCNMIDRVGVCTVCAKVCHKDHDLSYSKYGAFFCDCAGREGSTCMALVKRAPPKSNEVDKDYLDETRRKAHQNKGLTEQSNSGNSSRDRTDDVKILDTYQQKFANYMKTQDLVALVSESKVCKIAMNLLRSLIPSYVRFAQDKSIVSTSRSSKKRKLSSKIYRKPAELISDTSFPVDFFESLQVMNDIEFGGNDVLSVYSVQQLKLRLNSTVMHITCSKIGGFSLDIINNDANMVVCGLRIQVGVRDITKTPTSVELFGRTITINPITARWYDIPLTREESLQIDKKFTITFGPSADPNNITTIDSVRVYGQTKDGFSWPENGEDLIRSANMNGEDLIGNLFGREAGSHFQQLLIHSVEIMDLSLKLRQTQDVQQDTIKELAQEMATSLITVSYPAPLSRAIKRFLMTVYPGPGEYSAIRDQTALNFVTNSLARLKPEEFDTKLFSRVIYIMKSLCQTKLSMFNNLINTLCPIFIEQDPNIRFKLSTDSAKLEYVMQYVHELCQQLQSKRQVNMHPTSVCTSNSLSHEETLKPFIELLYIAMLHDLSISNVATTILVGYILNEDLEISLCARHTLIRLLRVRENEITDDTDEDRQENLAAADMIPELPTLDLANEIRPINETPNVPVAQDQYDPIPESSLFRVSSQQSSMASQLRNVLRDQMESVRNDNEEDIAIAIALSLQDDSQNNSVTDNAVTAAPTTSGRSELNFLSDRMPSAEELMSDTTASGVASDEEVSASGSRSVSLPKPSSSNRQMDCPHESSSLNLDAEHQLSPNNQEGIDKRIDIDLKNSTMNSKSASRERIHQQHIVLLQKLIERLPETRDAGGYRSISLLHVILVLTLDLDYENDLDNQTFKDLLCALQKELLSNLESVTSLIERSPLNEVKLVIMRMFSILMSKVRTSTIASTVSNSMKAETNSCWSTYCSFMTASSLIDSNVLDFCLNVLKTSQVYWKNMADNLRTETIQSSLDENILPINKKASIKNTVQEQLPDLAPFFLRSHYKGNTDLFDDHTQLLTEMVLRIPYQIKKVSSSSSNNLKPVVFSNEWSTILCEYLMIQVPSFIKKHVRKLLTFICGSKENYRQLRDFHFIESHMKSVKSICGIINNEPPQRLDAGSKSIPLNYEAMSSLVEHLKACIEIAQNRCINWQVYCLLKDQSLLGSLITISLSFGEDVSPIVLELLQHALSPPPLKTDQNIGSVLSGPDISSATQDSNIGLTFRDTMTPESLHANLAQQLISSISKEVLSKFVQAFLLETNLSTLRWQAHGLLFNLWSNFSISQQREMLLIFWSLWHNLPKYGRKAAQFVDIIGYMTLKSPESEAGFEKVFCQETLNVLRQQNALLMNHPNAHIYSSIQGLVDLESYYLESEPCSVCNSPEIGYSNIKLSSIKVDSRFTTTTQIIKLIGSHTILKFSLRISDIKRSKMVKTISIYYNNRSVQSVVELKNKMNIWSLARKYNLSPSQTEVKIEFTLPIVACNLMIEFSEFYENHQASSETLQCPRCSTSVAANPGVCNNCGENVFQCHKCRAINYDEKDPFLCISCGFCKYARFDISLIAKPTCAVDPIENEEDRKKTVTSISNLMEKGDRVYRNLMQNKPILELLLLRIHEQILPDKQYDESYLNIDNGLPQTSSGVPSSSNNLQNQPIIVSYASPSGPTSLTPSVNKAIQHLAQKYCVECKSLFEELSKITHKVLASRKELVDYDNRQLRRSLNTNSSVLSSARVYSSLSSGSGRCYGCASATVDHCVTMLKALSTLPSLRSKICESGIINELVNFNMRNGSYRVGQEIRQLLCALTRGDLNSTTTLTDLLMEKIEAISKQDYQPYEISNIVKHELSLLSVTLHSDDNCWELRLRCLMKIFAFALELKNPTVMECLVIPCLRLLLSIVRPPVVTTRRHKDKSLESIASVRPENNRARVPLQEWLNESNFVFDDWRKRAAKPSSTTQSGKTPKSVSLRRQSKSQHRANYLIEKYSNRWKSKCQSFGNAGLTIDQLPNDWLKRLLFNRSSKTVRSMAKTLVESLFDVQSRRQEIVDLLTGYLDEVGAAGESAYEFYQLYKQIISVDHWRHYLALKHILIRLCDLINSEIDSLQELEETTLNSSLSSGYSLKMLLDIFTEFVSVPEIHSHYKSRLVGFVLKGYLSLRKLVVQRTKVIDEAQEMLLELLEGMTTGSESETASFINVCVDAIRNCHEGDIRTPVFIFERLCSTIHPEENANSEFFVSIEKDPQQEDYLQGRMLGNPYSSNEPGIGPLMKDIKNKICQDCELLALLEDDSSMELLVSNKIICLDLQVRDVYKRIWCVENHESEAMRIVYRMRGLLGDATEEFIESLNSRTHEEVDEEQVYKMANIMSSSGGLEIMLNCLKNIDDLSPPYKPLLDVILKLFNQCSKTKNNREKLISSDLKTPEILLRALKLALNESEFLEAAGLPGGIDQEASSQVVAELGKTPANLNQNPRTNVVDQILGILETILREASQQPAEVYMKLCSESCGTIDDLYFLLKTAQTLVNRLPHISHKIIQVTPFLTFGIKERMLTLLKFFKSSIDFETFDQDHSASSDSNIDLFCIMVDAIEQNENGNRLKDFIVDENIVAKSIRYLTSNAPPLKSSLLATSEEWKDFTTRPALKYVLRILGGLSQDHSSTQVLISLNCIPIVHGLEQVSSDAHVGTLAENLLEAIKQHPLVAEKVDLVRRQTKEEKKRLAMAVRERQLGALGMDVNERGQVMAKSKLLEQCLDLAEDTGLICNICREGYKFQPAKVLGIYTYTKRCVLDEFEMKPRKSYGYTTVTHFNTVHVDCHLSAVRSARGRDEWDSAALQNANTRCNGLLPIWGPQVPESSYANALARHNSYLQDSTGYRDISYHSTIHDIRLQLLRFAQERSFSEDTGGGGPQSNLHLLPYMMQTALYVLNSTKAATREYKRALNFLETSPTEMIESCYEVDGPYYWCALALLVLPPVWWKRKRVQFLQRLIVCNHVRRVNIKPPAPMSDTRVRAYSYYKSALIFFAFIDSFYNIVFKDSSSEEKWSQDWSASLADYLKHNEQTINDNIEVLLNLYQNSLLTCTTLDRFFEIIRIDEISQPSEFIVNTLELI